MVARLESLAAWAIGGFGYVVCEEPRVREREDERGLPLDASILVRGVRDVYDGAVNISIIQLAFPLNVYDRRVQSNPNIFEKSVAKGCCKTRMWLGASKGINEQIITRQCYKTPCGTRNPCTCSYSEIYEM